MVLVWGLLEGGGMDEGIIYPEDGSADELSEGGEETEFV